MGAIREILHDARERGECTGNYADAVERMMVEGLPLMTDDTVRVGHLVHRCLRAEAQRRWRRSVKDVAGT